MNGSLTKVSIPQVVAGGQIKATIGYSATNPGAYYWKTFIIAVAGTYIQKEVSATREIGEMGSNERTYSIGEMPNKKIALGIYLFAHDDAGYDWDWNDFWAWTGGYSNSSMAQCLDYKITVLEPTETNGGDLQTLEVDITPAQGGYVTTSPSPLDIANNWSNGSKGKFNYGTVVEVTAHPSTGYEFYKWSDEIQGGVSYSNPEYVSGTMNEHKAVKCHFRESGVEPPPPECSVDADCPDGYICQNGVCVPEGTPPSDGTDWLPWLAIGAGAIIVLSQARGKEKPKTKPRRKK
jgi:Cys-rich repeat protein